MAALVQPRVLVSIENLVPGKNYVIEDDRGNCVLGENFTRLYSYPELGDLEIDVPGLRRLGLPLNPDLMTNLSGLDYAPDSKIAHFNHVTAIKGSRLPITKSRVFGSLYNFYEPNPEDTPSHKLIFDVTVPTRDGPKKIEVSLNIADITGDPQEFIRGNMDLVMKQVAEKLKTANGGKKYKSRKYKSRKYKSRRV
jgi:hypothetical protein